MKNWILFAVLIILAACQEETTVNADAEFDKYKEAFVLRLWEMHPGWASGSGYHKYDSILVVPNRERQQKELEFIRKESKQLDQFAQETLSEANQIDLKLMRNYLDGAIWEQESLKSGEWNPSNYNVCGGFAEMLGNNYAPLDERLRNFSIRLKNVPAYYKAAAVNIKNPTKEHTQLAIEQNRGGLSVFTVDLPASLAKSGLSDAEKTTLKEEVKLPKKPFMSMPTGWSNFRTRIREVSVWEVNCMRRNLSLIFSLTIRLKRSIKVPWHIRKNCIKRW